MAEVRKRVRGTQHIAGRQDHHYIALVKGIRFGQQACNARHGTRRTWGLGVWPDGKAWRGRAGLVQDEFDLKGTSEVAWGITTPAEIKPEGGKATLSQQGRKLVAEILAPPDASFAVESAEREPPEARNEGISMLIIRLPAQDGKVRIAVLLSPVWPDGKATTKPTIRPLRNWWPDRLCLSVGLARASALTKAAPVE